MHSTQPHRVKCRLHRRWEDKTASKETGQPSSHHHHHIFVYSYFHDFVYSALIPQEGYANEVASFSYPWVCSRGTCWLVGFRPRPLWPIILLCGQSSSSPSYLPTDYKVSLMPEVLSLN